ncbi:TIM barrel protein [Hymenobacter sp. RP-2-7]|uniref:TIM barrel protein n=1 Tax=Hymenobacter polaris TaxID=2682546 RepID=A0A7Y0FLF4_9BACT|nr:sugar phosphate isomerase/epimerase family protein [Hymenobacter polaris]NML64753.1 TIM barrel protein [Hymenobacter polaris]
MLTSRRQFLKQAATVAATAAVAPPVVAAALTRAPFFEISLAEWSLHKALFAKKITNLDFPGIAKKDYGISAVEYVNQFFKDKAQDKAYLNELLQRCRDHGVRNHLIMVDGEGDLGAPSEAERRQAVENHYKWVDAAHHLGCLSIRVNAFGKGTAAEVQQAAVESLGRLSDYAQQAKLNVIVENHGSYTSDGKWLLSTIRQVGKRSVGILPDFGNFCIRRDTGELYQGKCLDSYDKYQAVREWMPLAKGVSAKTYEFDAAGNCVETDYPQMFRIIKDSGFTGYVGIEYEGERLSEDEGIRKTKALLEKVGRA